MRIIAKAAIKEFSAKHRDAKNALVHWYIVTYESHWVCFSDIKRAFNSVDYIGDNLYVFNIKGNKYRLIARIFFFPLPVVYIRFIGSHAEYETADMEQL